MLGEIIAGRLRDPGLPPRIFAWNPWIVSSELLGF